MDGVLPSAARDHRDPHEEGEEQLRQTAVDDGQRVLQEHDAQPPDEALDTDQSDGQETQAAHPPASVAPPEDRRRERR